MQGRVLPSWSLFPLVQFSKHNSPALGLTLNKQKTSRDDTHTAGVQASSCFPSKISRLPPLRSRRLSVQTVAAPSVFLTDLS